MPSPWIDVSVPLKSGMVHWPGEPAASITQVRHLDRGDRCTFTTLDMAAHAGTHMDAPAHFVRGGATMDALPLDAVMGRARVLDITARGAIRPAHLEPHRIRAGERLLFRTRNSTRAWATDEFVEDFVHISADAASWLAARRVRTVGVDYLSVGGYKKDGPETHLALLCAGIWIIEGLMLGRVRPGPVDLICLPLKLVGAEGAPARALVRQRSRERGR